MKFEFDGQKTITTAVRAPFFVWGDINQVRSLIRTCWTLFLRIHSLSVRSRKDALAIMSVFFFLLPPCSPWARRSSTSSMARSRNTTTASTIVGHSFVHGGNVYRIHRTAQRLYNGLVRYRLCSFPLAFTLARVSTSSSQVACLARRPLLLPHPRTMAPLPPIYRYHNVAKFPFYPPFCACIPISLSQLVASADDYCLRAEWRARRSVGLAAINGSGAGSETSVAPGTNAETHLPRVIVSGPRAHCKPPHPTPPRARAPVPLRAQWAQAFPCLPLRRPCHHLPHQIHRPALRRRRHRLEPFSVVVRARARARIFLRWQVRHRPCRRPRRRPRHHLPRQVHCHRSHFSRDHRNHRLRFHRHHRRRFYCLAFGGPRSGGSDSPANTPTLAWLAGCMSLSATLLCFLAH